MDRELLFLESIQANPEDELIRIVYADWLEEQDDPRAQYLRAEIEWHRRLNSSRLKKSVKRRALAEAQAALQATATSIDPSWIRQVSRSPIENCHEPDCDVEFGFECPEQWEQLDATADASVRHCGQCDRFVFFCDTTDEARALAACGECVAVDAAQSRRRNDLMLRPHIPTVGRRMGRVMFSQRTTKQLETAVARMKEARKLAKPKE